MGLLYVVALFVLTFNQILAESEHISINTAGDVPASTAEEAKRFSQEDELEDLLPMMFSRGKGEPARYKWGGGAYPINKQKKIVELHNEFRRMSGSSDMAEMLWSPKLAAQAQTWSDGCRYEHPDKARYTDYQGIGQNLYIKYLDTGGQNPPKPITDPITKWHDEITDYDYNGNTCSAVCGHYTQVVWSKSTKVGCGITFCPVARSSGASYKNAWLVTCNYSPGGNFVGEKPYQSGSPCTGCGKGFCMKKLCAKCKPGETGCACKADCGRHGSKVAKSCSCTCRDGYTGSDCNTLCEDTHKYCGANPGWPTSWCNDARYPFVDQNCPQMCGVC